MSSVPVRRRTDRANLSDPPDNGASLTACEGVVVVSSYRTALMRGCLGRAVEKAAYPSANEASLRDHGSFHGLARDLRFVLR